MLPLPIQFIRLFIRIVLQGLVVSPFVRLLFENGSWQYWLIACAINLACWLTWPPTYFIFWNSRPPEPPPEEKQDDVSDKSDT